VRSAGQDFLFYLAFFVSFLLVTLAETEWLRRRTKAATFPLLLVTFTSNILSLILSYLFLYLFFLIGVIAFGARETIALSLLIYLAGTLAITALPLATIKRLLVKLVRINGLTRPWTYAFVAAIAFQLSALGLPVLVAIFV